MSAHPQANSTTRTSARTRLPRLLHLLPAILLVSLGLIDSRPIVAAQSTAPALPTLTTCRAAHHLTSEEANRHYPVRLQAMITYYEIESDKTDPTLFVMDSSGSVYVSLTGPPGFPLAPGDLVEIDGVTSAGQYAPIVARASVVKTGHSELPTTAPRVGIADMLSGAQDGQWVEIEAVVHAVHIADGVVTLNLSMQGGTIVAGAPVEPNVDYTSLVDATILLRGNAAPLFNHQQQVTGGVISFPGMAGLKVEKPADPNPFSLPVTPAIELLRYTPDPGIRHRVHLRGQVTLFWPGRMLCLHDETDSLCAQISQTLSIKPGDNVDVIGFPVAGDFGPTLVYASYQPRGAGEPVPPLFLNTEQALSDQYDGELVSMDGEVIGEDAGAADQTVILSADNNIFSVVFAKDPKVKIHHLAVGTRVRVTGICSIRTDGSAAFTREGFPIAKSFRLLLRSPSDVMVLQKPSWWNAVHTLWVLAFAFVLALFALWRMALLSHRVKQQTAIIQAQLLETAALKDAAENATIAAEYHAAHDELTGALNRRSIFAELQKVFDAAAGSGYVIGVIMLDLDHFKRVNDTHGHLAGDEVLRETVRRLTPAVRSSDLLGRYGGEEFMIVLPRCDRMQLEACAERFRAAISRSPMRIGGVEITMTASVGATTITPPSIAMLDALAAADSALYQAKNSGRDRVVLKDSETGQFEDGVRMPHAPALNEDLPIKV